MLHKKNIYNRILSFRNSETWKSLWNDLKEAIGGTDKDFTRISLGKAIFLLSVPMVLEMVLESIFAVADILFVSKLGSDAIATVGITESLMTIVYAIGSGLSIATTALVSRRIGEHNRKKASFTAFQAIVTGLFVSIFIMIPGLFYARELLEIMGASKSVVETGFKYTMIMLSGNGIIILLFIINAIFRSSGDAAISMRILFVANLLNIVLDPCFIFGLGPFPELGVTGAAIATSCGRGIAVIYQFYILFQENRRIKFALKKLRISFKLVGKVLKLSLGGIGQNLIATSSWIFMVRIISEFGSEVVAGYTIAIRILIFTLLPSWGLANAAGTLVGQNLGAKRPERAQTAVWTAGILNMVLLGIVAIVFIANPDIFIRLFTREQNIVDAGAECLRIISYGYLCYALGMVMVQAFNGAGDTATPTWVNLVAFWMTEVPLAYFLALPAGLDQMGVFIAIVIGESILTIISVILFYRGRWKESVV